MKHALIAVVLSLPFLSGVSGERTHLKATAAPKVEYPAVNVPLAMREQNWRGDEGEGSCVHASMIMIFRWQGWPAMAGWWKQKYGNGEYSERLHHRLDEAKVRWAATTTGDVNFLEWACKTRRGCAVTTMGGRHMELLVHLDDVRAGVLDNNEIGRIKWFTRESFIRYWKESGGWAVTYVGTPAAPLPNYEK